MLLPKDWFISSSAARSLPEAQRRMYASERTENFRFLAKKFAVRSSRTLTSDDLASDDLQRELAAIGQFAEIAHGRLSPKFIWENMQSLSQPGFPLHGYDALDGSELVSAFRGTVADLQGYIAYQPQTKQLIVAFSGTSCFSQTLRNIDVRLVPYPGGDGCAVHKGFWQMYNGVRARALGVLVEVLPKRDIEGVICTGHSLGAVMCYLFALDVMGGSTTEITSHDCPAISLPLKLALFGSPRVGNQALRDHWRRVVAERNASGLSVQEYSVKGYNDGATTLPPHHLGFRHFPQTPLYFAHGCLYHIPDTESEYSSFTIEPSAMADSRPRVLEHALGGHNYYNGRDMEKLLRRMKWFDSGETDWDKYRDWQREEGET